MKLIQAAPLLVAFFASMAAAQTVSSTPSLSPTAAAPAHSCLANLPDESPTCWDSLDDIWCNEWIADQDWSVKRTYYLCPGDYTIGEGSTEDVRDEWFNGERSIFLTPNIEIICGDDGVASKDCVVGGGVFQVQGMGGGVRGTNLLQGITFQAASFFNFAVSAATQSITFKDCTFRDNTNGFLFYADTDEANVQGLNYTFEDVVFDNNANVERATFPGMITMNHAPSTMVFKRVIISNNKYNLESASLGYAINTVGNLVMDEVCFRNNEFKEWAPVISYSNKTTATNVYGIVDESLYCELAVDFDVGCIAEYDADVCFDGTEAPTLPPAVVTSPPSASPVAQPTVGSSASQPIALWSQLSFALFLSLFLVNAWIM